MTQEELDSRFYSAQKLINWLVDGYFINCVLSTCGPSQNISKEWVVENFNVEISYFEKNK
jgi:hypothetical protein